MRWFSCSAASILAALLAGEGRAASVTLAAQIAYVALTYCTLTWRQTIQALSLAALARGAQRLRRRPQGRADQGSQGASRQVLSSAQRRLTVCIPELLQISTSRQRLTTTDKKVLDDDDKSMSDYGLKDGDTVEVKDLGPQICASLCCYVHLYPQADIFSSQHGSWWCVPSCLAAVELDLTGSAATCT